MHHYGVFRRLLGGGAGEDGEMTRWGEIKCPRCAELEAKLAQALRALERIEVSTDTREQGAIAMATLAELKGQGDTCVSCGAPTPNDFCGFCLEEE
jgi:phage FluMu protein Com